MIDDKSTTTMNNDDVDEMHEKKNIWKQTTFLDKWTYYNSYNTTYLFVQFNPSQVALGVCILKPEEPYFTQPDRLNHLIE